MKSYKNIKYGYFGSIFFLFVFVVMLGITIYKSEILYVGTLRAHYASFFFISCLGILIFGIILRLNETIRQNIILFTFSCSIAAYSFELALWSGLKGLIDPSVSRSVLEKQTKAGFDFRTEQEHLEDLINNGEEATRRVLPAYFTMSNGIENKNIFPLAGISKKLTVHCNESGKMQMYQSDRHGFNNPDYVWDDKETLFITIGDSFTHGDCVEQNQSIAGNLQFLTKKSGINLGMGGNGPLLNFATFMEYGEKVRPKFLIWNYVESNDLFDLASERTSSILMKYLNGEIQGLVAKQQEIDQYLESYLIKQMKQSQVKGGTFMKKVFLERTRSIISNYLSGSKEIGEGYFDSSWPLFRDILLTTDEKVRGWGGQLIFVYLPTYGRYVYKDIDQDKFMDKGRLLKSVEEIGIYSIDLHSSLFSLQDNPLQYFPFETNGHYNHHGYLEISKVIAENINSINKH